MVRPIVAIIAQTFNGAAPKDAMLLAIYRALPWVTERVLEEAIADGLVVVAEDGSENDHLFALEREAYLRSRAEYCAVYPTQTDYYVLAAPLLLSFALPREEAGDQGGDHGTATGDATARA